MSSQAAISSNAQADSPKPAIVDDKSPHCIPFILELLQDAKAEDSGTKPFIIGLNGIQGAGKTTLVTSLAEKMADEGLETLVLSIDDLYLTREDQVVLAASSTPRNPLLQHRGEPGTHDMGLAASVFSALKDGKEVAIPQYDKSAFNGQGDRVPAEHWKVVNKPGDKKIQVVIFEGWCVGFRALLATEIQAKQDAPSKTLKKHRLQDLLFVNDKLQDYEVLNESFDAFIHIDAQDTSWVYGWREQQEVALRKAGRGGMTSEAVVRFVDGYYPAYELYTDALRAGIFKGQPGMSGKQLRLIVGQDRKVVDVVRI